MKEVRKCKTCGDPKPLNHKHYDHSKGGHYGKKYWARECKDCRRKKAGYMVQNTRHSPFKRGDYRCVEEPEMTGFKGRLFHYRMFLNMLDDGTLPPGTIWQNERTGRKYKVVGNEVYHKFPERFEDAKGQKLRWVR